MCVCIHVQTQEHTYVHVREIERDKDRDMNRIRFTLFDSHCFNQIKMLSVLGCGDEPREDE